MKTKVFHATAVDCPFDLLMRVEKFLQDNHFTVGSLFDGDPVGFKRDAKHVAQWRTLSETEREALDGYIMIDGGSYRNPEFIAVVYND